MLNMSFEEALDGKHLALFCCLLSRGKHQLHPVHLSQTY